MMKPTRYPKLLNRSAFLGVLAALGLAVASCGTTAPGTGGAASGAVKPYPRDTCLVTGNTLGSMGDPVTLVHGDREIKFCCKPCVAKFKADPQKYLSKL